MKLSVLFGVLQMTVGIILRSQTEGWNLSRLFSGNSFSNVFSFLWGGCHFVLAETRWTIAMFLVNLWITLWDSAWHIPVRPLPLTNSTIITPRNTFFASAWFHITAKPGGELPNHSGEYNDIMALWIAGGAILSMRRIWPTSSVNACPWWFSCHLSTTNLYTWRVGGKWWLATLKSCMRFRLRSATASQIVVAAKNLKIRWTHVSGSSLVLKVSHSLELWLWVLEMKSVTEVDVQYGTIWVASKS